MKIRELIEDVSLPAVSIGIITIAILGAKLFVPFSERYTSQPVPEQQAITSDKWEGCIAQGAVATEALAGLWPELDLLESLEGCMEIKIGDSAAWACHYKIPRSIDGRNCRAISYTYDCNHWRSACTCSLRGQDACGYSPVKDL